MEIYLPNLLYLGLQPPQMPLLLSIRVSVLHKRTINSLCSDKNITSKIRLASLWPDTADESSIWFRTWQMESVPCYKAEKNLLIAGVMYVLEARSYLPNNWTPRVSASCRAPSAPKMWVWWWQLGHWKTLMFCTRPRTCRNTKHQHQLQRHIQQAPSLTGLYVLFRLPARWLSWTSRLLCERPAGRCPAASTRWPHLKAPTHDSTRLRWKIRHKNAKIISVEVDIIWSFSCIVLDLIFY